MFSFVIQRAISGDWVAWKPLIAPQAMEMNIIGKIGFFSYLVPNPFHISGKSGLFT